MQPHNLTRGELLNEASLSNDPLVVALLAEIDQDRDLQEELGVVEEENEKLLDTVDVLENALDNAKYVREQIQSLLFDDFV